MSDDVLLDNHDIEHVIETIGRRLRERRGAPAPHGGRDPDWTSDDGRPIATVVREHVEQFRDSMRGLPLRDFHGTVLQRVTDGVLVTGVEHIGFRKPPEPRDLRHVYGPDRDAKHERRYYRFAWTDGSPGGSIIFAKAPQIIGQGLLQANAYAYSGQSAFAVTGAGMLFVPEHGAAQVAVRPYLPWRTTASFTHSTWDEEPEATRASVSCLLGILVESWKAGDAAVRQEQDAWITAYAHTTTDLLHDVPAAGTATVGDGLATSFVAVPGRRYGIYVYAWLEASASPQVHKNQYRFCTIDVDASVPFVVAEETLL
ncbi:hypothetical protein [Agrococcus carbonis]|uniref:Uncharacterized protein n=1 Tax=Agrococcus carbonis TaxID=684552 RepID=A0A1H1NYH2_9MICO|nr:hypothetical protein [Agrococcus carbonis]SDS03825.1 hypothetical protein SAMN04489719_1395 [Agrococcus carbonis]